MADAGTFTLADILAKKKAREAALQTFTLADILAKKRARENAAIDQLPAATNGNEMPLGNMLQQSQQQQQPPADIGALQNFSNAFQSGVVGVTSGAVGLFNPPLARAMQEEVAQTAPTRPGFSQTAGSALGSAAFMVPAIATTGPASLVAAGAGLGAFGASGAGSMRLRIEDWEKETGQTLEPWKKYTAVTLGGAIDAGLEATAFKFGLKNILKHMPLSKVIKLSENAAKGNFGVVKGLLLSSATEAGEEVTEEMAADATAAVLFEGKKAFNDWQERYKESAIGGAIGGAGMTGVGAIAKSARVRAQGRLDEAQQQEAAKQKKPKTTPTLPTVAEIEKGVSELPSGELTPEANLVQQFTEEEKELSQERKDELLYQVSRMGNRVTVNNTFPTNSVEDRYARKLGENIYSQKSVTETETLEELPAPVVEEPVVKEPVAQDVLEAKEKAKAELTGTKEPVVQKPTKAKAKAKAKTLTIKQQHNVLGTVLHIINTHNEQEAIANKEAKEQAEAVGQEIPEPVLTERKISFEEIQKKYPKLDPEALDAFLQKIIPKNFMFESTKDKTSIANTQGDLEETYGTTIRIRKFKNSKDKKGTLYVIDQKTGKPSHTVDEKTGELTILPEAERRRVAEEYTPAEDFTEALVWDEGKPQGPPTNISDALMQAAVILAEAGMTEAEIESHVERWQGSLERQIETRGDAGKANAFGRVLAHAKAIAKMRQEIVTRQDTQKQKQTETSKPEPAKTETKTVRKKIKRKTKTKQVEPETILTKPVDEVTEQDIQQATAEELATMIVKQEEKEKAAAAELLDLIAEQKEDDAANVIEHEVFDAALDEYAEQETAYTRDQDESQEYYLLSDDEAEDNLRDYQHAESTEEEIAPYAQQELVVKLLHPMFEAGIIHDIRLTDQQLTDQQGNPVYAYLETNPKTGKRTMVLSEFIALNTIGHEGAHALIRALGANDPYVRELMQLTGNDLEAALDIVGDVFYSRVMTPHQGRVARWIQRLWAYAANKLGLNPTTNQIVLRMNDYMTGFRPITFDQIRSGWSVEADQKLREYQYVEKEPQNNLRNFLSPEGLEFFNKVVEESVKPERIPINMIKTEAEAYWKPKHMVRIVSDVLTGKGLNPGELVALVGYSKKYNEALGRLFKQVNWAERERLIEMAKPMDKAVNTAVSNAGRSMRYLQINPLDVDAPVSMIIKIQEQLGRKLTKIEQDKIDATDMTNPDDLRRLYERLKPPRIQDLFQNMYTNFLLSGPAIGANLLLNFTKLAYANAESVVAISSYKTLSPLLPGLKWQKRYWDELIPQWKAQAAGLTKGTKLAAETIVKAEPEGDASILLDLGVDSATVWDKYAERAVDAVDRTTMKALGYTINLPLRFMIAGDVLLRSAYYQQEMALKIHREARDKGYRMGSKEYVTYTKARIDNPTKEDIDEAKLSAAEGVFMGQAGTVLKNLKGVRNWAGIAGWLAIPFVHTLGKVMEWSAQRVPIIGAAVGSKGTDPADLIARQIGGVMAAALILRWLDDDDEKRVIGAIPKDINERQAFWRLKKRPWSVDVTGEGDWIQLERDPYFAVWKTAMLVKDVMKNSAEGDYETKTDAFWDLSQQLTQEFIRSSFISTIFSAPRSDTSLAKEAYRIPAGFVPFSGFMRAAQRTYEAYTKGYVNVKDAKYPVDFVYPDPLRQSMASLFGVQEAPNKLNVWGEEVQLKTSVLNEWLPYKTWRENTDPLEQALAKVKFFPGMPGRHVTIQGYDVELPDALYRQHVVYTGKLLKDRLQTITNLKAFQKANADIQTRLLKTADSAVRTAANQKARVEVVLNHQKLLEQAKAKVKLGR